MSHSRYVKSTDKIPKPGAAVSLLSVSMIGLDKKMSKKTDGNFRKEARAIR